MTLWLLAELNKIIAEEEVIDMVLDNLVIGNSNIDKHGVVRVCVKSVLCPEDCQGHCRNINTIIYDDSNIMQVEQDDVQLVEDGLESRGRIRNNKTQWFGMPGDFNSLDPHAE